MSRSSSHTQPSGWSTVPDSLEESNAQYMRSMGLDPDALGTIIPSDANDPNRCPSLNATSQRCARLTHAPGTPHARGYDRWAKDGDVPWVAIKDGPTITTPEGFESAIPVLAKVDRAGLIEAVDKALRELAESGEFIRANLAEIAVDTVLERLAQDG